MCGGLDLEIINERAGMSLEEIQRAMGIDGRNKEVNTTEGPIIRVKGGPVVHTDRFPRASYILFSDD